MNYGLLGNISFEFKRCVFEYFDIILILNPNFFQGLSSCFLDCLLDPFGYIDFESPFDSYCSINLQFPSISCIIST